MADHTNVTDNIEPPRPTRMLITDQRWCERNLWTSAHQLVIHDMNYKTMPSLAIRLETRILIHMVVQVNPSHQKRRDIFSSFSGPIDIGSLQRRLLLPHACQRTVLVSGPSRRGALSREYPTIWASSGKIWVTTNLIYLFHHWRSWLTSTCSSGSWKCASIEL